jgi:hypothetical protein
VNLPEDPGSWDVIGTIYQGPVRVHGSAQCAGSACCIHNPSNHHMKTWPLVFVPGPHSGGYRVCEHQVVHPDPDSQAYLISQGEPFALLAMLTHKTVLSCDGCCTPEGSSDGRQ